MKRQFVFGSSAAASLPIPTLGPPSSAWKCKFCLKVFVEKTEFDCHLQEDHSYYETQEEIMISSVCSLDKGQEFNESKSVSPSTSAKLSEGNEPPLKRRKANNITETETEINTEGRITFKIEEEAGSSSNSNITLEDEASDSVSSPGVPGVTIKEENEGSSSKLKIDEFHSVSRVPVPVPVPATVISSIGIGEFQSETNNTNAEIDMGETYDEANTDPFANIKCQILEYSDVNTGIVESDHSPAVSETITNYIDDDIGIGIDTDIHQPQQQPQNIQISDPHTLHTRSSSSLNNPRDLADEFDEFKSLCVQNFAQIHSKQASIESMCKEIMRKLDCRNSPCSGYSAGQVPGHRILSATEFRFGFPFKTEDSLLEFDSKISSDLTLRGNAVRCLSLIGGSDVVEMCNSIIRKMMSDEVLTKFSYCGTAEKKSFSGLEINKLIFDAVYANRSTSTAPEKEIRKAIMNFVCHASDRLKYHLKKGSSHNISKKGPPLPVPPSSNPNRIKQLTKVSRNNNINTNTNQADAPSKPIAKRTY